MTSYKNMEEVLKTINQKYVTLKNEAVAYNNELLKATLDRMITAMKKNDELFKLIYERTFFGGSYYDNLKVEKPDEFDIHLLLVLPKICESHKTKDCGCVKLVMSNKPGFLWFKMKESFNSRFKKFIEGGFMRTDLFLNWIKGLVMTALRTFNDPSLKYSFDTPKYLSESGPALTLCLNGKFGQVDVDLVPAFKFGSNFWPPRPFRQNPSKTKVNFFIVPKKAKKMPCGERYWRASFQDQERELIEGKQRLKPALRLLKKMRNNLDHASISSYALKNLVLKEMDNGLFDQKLTLSDTFMKLLEKYKNRLSEKKIPYYWYNKDNIIEDISHITLTNHHNEIDRKLRYIKNNYRSDPLVVAKIILKEGTEEYRLFMHEQKKQCSL